MAQFLVRAVDNKHPDPIIDQQSCYKRGDIVVVKPDSHTWGRLEGPPNFVVIKVPGLPIEKAKKYVQEHRDPVSGELSRRRLFRLRLEDLPATIKQQLKEKGEVTVTVTQVKQYLRNKLTGLDEA